MPPAVADELTRLVRRWHELPLDQALARVPAVRSVVESLAGEPVPDHGPAVLMDQLRVVAYDACAAGRGADVGARLTALRRALAEPMGDCRPR